jgi:predicted small secreted protein
MKTARLFLFALVVAASTSASAWTFKGVYEDCKAKAKAQMTRKNAVIATGVAVALAGLWFKGRAAGNYVSETRAGKFVADKGSQAGKFVAEKASKAGDYVAETRAGKFVSAKVANFRAAPVAK